MVSLLLSSCSLILASDGETSASFLDQPPPVIKKPIPWLPVVPNYENLEWKDVTVCCRRSNPSVDTNTCADNVPLIVEPTTIGSMPQFTTDQALEVLKQAKEAWKGGAGVWPQMTYQQRIEAIEHFFVELAASREDIVETLMWEIGKNRKDAESEFDRTLQFARSVIDAIQTDNNFNGTWQEIGNVRALVRRAAIGVILCLGPYNYPLNETYATLIPALLLGNICILKIPTIGGLVHLQTMEAFAKSLPPGTIHFIAGSGRETMPPLMKTGEVDGLAFIGGSRAADDLIHQHPHPHRLKVFLQLEAKNMGIFLKDTFEKKNAAMLGHAMDETLLGTLSYNGQRCTAIKLLFVPSDDAPKFVAMLVDRVSSLVVGLPWDQKDGTFSQITPLPTPQRVEYMRELIDDAVYKGAEIRNENGGNLIGGVDSTLMVPAVLYPVTPNMRIYHEEQFGPIIPVATYDDLETALEFGQSGEYGQQVSVFGSDSDSVASIIDRFSAVYGKVNLNCQCGRSPDTLPFAGRRSSAMGVMSVTDILREFSVPTVISYKEQNGLNDELLQGTQLKSNFLQPVTRTSLSTIRANRE